jgi:hypothetical protein
VVRSDQQFRPWRTPVQATVCFSLHARLLHKGRTDRGAKARH